VAFPIVRTSEARDFKFGTQVY